MATGYRINGKDFEDLFEQRRNSSDPSAGINTNGFKQSKSGSTPLSNFIAPLGISPAEFYQSLVQGGSLDIALLLRQGVETLPVVRKGFRPGLTSAGWNWSYVTSDHHWFFIKKHSEDFLSIIHSKWSGDPNVIPRTSSSVINIPASQFPNGFVPEVLFYAISGGGGGGGGGSYLWNKGAGGGGGGAVAIGWMYTYSDNPLYSPAFILGNGGGAGSYGAYATYGGGGVASRIVQGPYAPEYKLFVTLGGGGRGQGDKGSSSSRGTASVSTSIPGLLATTSGGAGGSRGSSGGSVGLNVPANGENFLINSSGGAPWSAGTNFPGGGGGASYGVGGGSGRSPQMGGGGRGGNGGIGTANNGQAGAGGSLILFY